MKKFALLFLLLLTACDGDAGMRPISDSPTGAGTATYLGTVDGCRLWSVRSGLFYFANCRGGVTSTGWTRMVGKTIHHYAASSDSD